MIAIIIIVLLLLWGLLYKTPSESRERRTPNISEGEFKLNDYFISKLLQQYLLKVPATGIAPSPSDFL
jgi:hypothetical protein